MKNSENLREFSRVPTRFEVEVSFEGRPPIRGTTNSISMKGFFIECDHSLPVGADCQIVLFLNDQADKMRINVSGKIVRLEENGMVVGFSKLPMESFNHLRNLVLYNSFETAQVEKEFKEHLGLRKIP